MLSAFGSSFCWTTLGIYITTLSKNYSKLMGVEFKDIQTFFFGLAGSMFSLAYVIGYGLSGIILVTEDNHKNKTIVHYDYAAHCGVNNCPSTKLPDSKSKVCLEYFRFNVF